MRLAGTMQATLHRIADQRIEGIFTGDLREMSIDGKPIPLAPNTLHWELPAWAGPVAAGVFLLLAAHTASGRWRFGRLDQAMDSKDYRRALGLSRGFHGHPVLTQDAALAAAICLLALGQPNAARARLASRPRWTARRRPMRDFLLARAEAALGRRDEATRRLASSLAAEPSLLAQAQSDPVLSRVLGAVRPASTEEAYA
jgi:hypothetical protein